MKRILVSVIIGISFASVNAVSEASPEFKENLEQRFSSENAEARQRAQKSERAYREAQERSQAQGRSTYKPEDIFEENKQDYNPQDAQNRENVRQEFMNRSNASQQSQNSQSSVNVSVDLGIGGKLPEDQNNQSVASGDVASKSEEQSQSSSNSGSEQEDNSQFADYQRRVVDAPSTVKLNWKRFKVGLSEFFNKLGITGLGGPAAHKNLAVAQAELAQLESAAGNAEKALARLEKSNTYSGKYFNKVKDVLQNKYVPDIQALEKLFEQTSQEVKRHQKSVNQALKDIFNTKSMQLPDNQDPVQFVKNLGEGEQLVEAINNLDVDQNTKDMLHTLSKKQTMHASFNAALGNFGQVNNLKSESGAAEQANKSKQNAKPTQGADQEQSARQEKSVDQKEQAGKQKEQDSQTESAEKEESTFESTTNNFAAEDAKTEPEVRNFSSDQVKDAWLRQVTREFENIQSDIQRGQNKDLQAMQDQLLQAATKSVNGQVQFSNVLSPSGFLLTGKDLTTYYDMFGMDANATSQISTMGVDKAAKRLKAKTHPDKWRSDKDYDTQVVAIANNFSIPHDGSRFTKDNIEEVFQLVGTAEAIVTDPEKRSVYDAYVGEVAKVYPKTFKLMYEDIAKENQDLAVAGNFISQVAQTGQVDMQSLRDVKNIEGLSQDPMLKDWSDALYQKTMQVTQS